MTETTHDATDETDRTGDTGAERLDGLSLDDAVDRVVANDGPGDRETVRASLRYAAADGTVRRDALDDALNEASKLVATAESRAEFARLALDDARAAAEPVADLAVVSGRLDRFEAAVEAVEERAAELGPALTSEAVDTAADGDLFAAADGIRRIEARARDVQRTADDCQFDLEEFERWLDSPTERVSDLSADADALADSLDGLADAADEVAAAVDRSAEATTPEGAARALDGEPGRVWFDATLRHRATALTVADLRADLADLRTWAEREGDADSAADLDDLDARLDDLDARRESLGERLAALALPAWTDRYGDRIAAFERDLDGMAPPVDWRAVQDALDERRAGAETG